MREGDTDHVYDSDNSLERKHARGERSKSQKRAD